MRNSGYARSRKLASIREWGLEEGPGSQGITCMVGGLSGHDLSSLSDSSNTVLMQPGAPSCQGGKIKGY